MIAIPIVESLIKRNSKKKMKTACDFDKRKSQKNKYHKILAWMWGPAVVVFIMSFIGDISLADLGFRAISFNYNIWFTSIALIASGLVIIYSWYSIILSLLSKKFKEKMKAEIAAYNDGEMDILPRTKKEKWMYVLVSSSSGICEEFVYRGFALFLLQAVFPGIPILIIVLFSCMMFGIGHIYQGWEGIIETGLIGAIFMGVLIATNSIIPVMILHFLSNVSGTFFLPDESTL